MPSLHNWRGIEAARRHGGLAGSEHATALWDMSKRELVELALRLTPAGMNGNAEEAAQQVFAEHAALKANGIL